MDVDESDYETETASQLVDAIVGDEVEPGGEGRQAFVTTSPNWWGGDRTFGGMVVAQALHAATRTVSEGLDVHSLHGYFLRPTSPGSESTHRVERIRDGRTFTTREVTTEVDGKIVFRMACSFHTAEEGDDYQLPVGPGITTPDGIKHIDGSFLFDIRELGPTERRADGTFQSTRRCWFKTRERLDDDPAIHACVLAYFSDMTGASFRPNSLGVWGTHTDASLDHTLWFHRPARADEWSIFDLQALVNAGGRATIRATMHGEGGSLHLSMAQELLIRKLEVPLVFEVPGWVDPDRARPVPGAGDDGGTDGTT